MELNDFVRIPFYEGLKQMDLIDTKINLDNQGFIRSVELKYIFPDVDERNPFKVTGKKGR